MATNTYVSNILDCFWFSYEKHKSDHKLKCPTAEKEREICHLHQIHSGWLFPKATVVTVI